MLAATGNEETRGATTRESPTPRRDSGVIAHTRCPRHAPRPTARVVGGGARPGQAAGAAGRLASGISQLSEKPCELMPFALLLRVAMLTKAM